MEDHVQNLIDTIKRHVEIKELNAIVVDYEIMNMFLNKEQEKLFIECVEKGIVYQNLKKEIEKYELEDQICIINPNVRKEERYAYAKNLANMWYRVRARVKNYTHPWIDYERYVGGAKYKNMAHENFVGLYFYPLGQCK